MLVPFGSSHGETVGKNEAERIEVFSATHINLSSRLRAKNEREINLFLQVQHIVVSQNNILFTYPLAVLNRKIYLMQLSLLL
jgi:hypothetical protein